MKILLVCSAGMSTSLLVNNMYKFAEKEDFIEALPESRLRDVIDNFDVVLVGPQMRFKLPEIKKLTESKGKPAEVIDMLTYGTMNGEAALKQAKNLLNNK